MKLTLGALLMAAASTAVMGQVPVVEEAKDEPIRIMCLGDSITVGYTDNPHWKVPFKFGYRSRLYTLLKGAGYYFTFVGDSPQPWNKMSGDPTHGGTYKPAFDCAILGLTIIRAEEVLLLVLSRAGCRKATPTSFCS